MVDYVAVLGTLGGSINPAEDRHTMVTFLVSLVGGEFNFAETGR
jgi:hypothetical protein